MLTLLALFVCVKYDREIGDAEGFLCFLLFWFDVSILVGLHSLLESINTYLAC